MTWPLCPVCGEEIPSASLEGHMRLELGLPAFRCRLCLALLYSPPEAQSHPPQHPGAEECLEPQPLSLADQRKLDEAIRLAGGGPGEWVKRLCFCGGCQRLCHDETYIDASAQAKNEASVSEDDENLRIKELESTKRTERGEKSSSSQPSPAKISGIKKPRSVEGRPGKRPKVPSLKRELPNHDKLPCRECKGMAVSKGSLRHHVLRHHIKARPFACAKCPAKSFFRSGMVQHQKTVHGLTLTKDTFTEAQPVEPEVIKFWLEPCFGVSYGARSPRVRCSGCGERVRRADAARHVAKSHLKEPLHKCRACPFFVTTHDLGNMTRHLRAVHRLRPSAATVDSSGKDANSGTIAVMVKELFGHLPTPSQDRSEADDADGEHILSGWEDAESRMPVDVDPGDGEEREELSRASSRLNCRLCEREVTRYHLSHHAELHHMPPGNVYQCLLCPFGTRLFPQLSDHVNWEHEEKPSSQTYSRLFPKATLKQRIRDCFGETQKLPWAELRCRGCEKQVRVIDRKRHVAVAHLKKAHFSCRICGYEVKSSDRGKMNQHVKAKHLAVPGTENINDSGIKKHAPVIQAMITELFPA